MTPPRTVWNADALRQRVTVTPPGCWEWNLTRNRGYGRAWMYDHHEYAHRLAWRIFVGPIPDGMQVLHQCDNPPCCNPDHLFLGTRTDNMRDARDKGRLNPKPPLGERHPFAKLTTEQVLDIRAAHKDGEAKAAIARRFDVSRASVTKIISRDTWKHVRDEVAA